MSNTDVQSNLASNYTGSGGISGGGAGGIGAGDLGNYNTTLQNWPNYYNYPYGNWYPYSNTVYSYPTAEPFEIKGIGSNVFKFNRLTGQSWILVGVEWKALKDQKS